MPEAEARIVATPASRPILLLPAMGVPPAYYQSLAGQLTQCGFVVTLAELGGPVPASASIPGESPVGGYAEMIERTIPAAYTTAQSSVPGRRVVVVGHSLGGQLGLVAAGKYFPDAPFVLVASGTAHYRAFSKIRGLVYLAGSQAISGSARLIGSWPGDRFGFGGRQSAETMRDWARNVRNGRYSSAGATFDYADALGRFRGDVLAMHVTQDRLAPIEATQMLLSLTRAANITSVAYTAERGTARPGSHFTWVRDQPGVAPQIDTWTSQIAGPSGRAGHDQGAQQ